MKAALLACCCVLVLTLGRASAQSPCDACTLAPPVGVATRLCLLNGTTIADSFCEYDTMPTEGNEVGVGACLWRNVPKMGVLNAGSCACPNDCSASYTGSVCDEAAGHCACASGWVGADCSMVACPNECSGRGVCQTVVGQDACVCYAGFTGQDCSAPALSLPEVVETVSGNRFDDWDDYGTKHPVFNQSVIAQVRLTMATADLEFLLDPANSASDEYMHADMWFYNGEIKETVPDVGVRLQGSMMKLYPKKNFKVSFSTFEDGRDWYKLKHVDFKSASLDVSYVREIAASTISYSMNSPASRESWANLFINGINWGTYILIEDMDSQFYKSRFGNAKTPVYKTHFGANFSYLGSDPAIYEGLMCPPSPCYQPETDEAYNYTKLANFLYVLNEVADDAFQDEIERVFDVNAFLQAYVMEVITGNWDGLANNGNNIMLYLDGKDRFVYWRHDLDLSLGFPKSVGLTITPFDTTDVYNWADNILPTRILSVPDYHKQYTTLFKDLMKTYFMLSGAYVNMLVGLQDIARSSVASDVVHTTCLGYTVDEFDLSLTHTYGDVLGVTEYMNNRIDSANKQLDN
eukprot:TRINITY_DN1169_c0_g3_i7.p1 TRINITY_DN1169_c0_g3~~TRINITY_DN1169_c0_g3_i7.p1  ORF type:complete len:599 (-),score=125.79 TRINITY_DN1169_c0_g3_i7:1225-2955(-)